MKQDHRRDGVESRLANFPISFFSIIMGLSGLAIAWTKAQHVFNIDSPLHTLLTALASVALLLLFIVYGAKIALYPQAVIKELKHPIKLSFFPTISISLLLLSIAFLEINQGVSHFLWVSGAALHLMFTLFVFNSWMHHEHFKVNHINPAWFIPAVGNVLVPIAGVPLGYIDVSWFFFSIGIMFWIILMTIFFNRILFHDPLAKHLLPTLFIMIAPPAVSFIAYMRLNGAMDNFAIMLYFMGLFLTLLLLSQVKHFIRLPFFLSWWAYSFPLAAITIASFTVFEQTSKPFYLWVATGLLILLSGIISILIFRTFKAIKAHGICIPEH